MQRMIIQSACFHQWVNLCYLPLICLWGVNSCTIIVVLWRNASYIDRAAALHYAVPFPISILIWFQIITQPQQHEKESFTGGRQKWAYINNPISSRNMCCATLSQLDSSYNRWARLPRRRFVSSSDRNTIFVCFREGVIVYGSDSLTGIWQLLIKR